MASSRVLRPATLNEASALLRYHRNSARLVAGGTGLQLEWAAGASRADWLVDLGAMRDDGAMHCVEPASGGLRIGALNTLSSLRNSGMLRQRFSILWHAIAGVGATSVRNLATIGGNVASGNGCLLPALLVLDADIEIFDGKSSVIHPVCDWIAAGRQIRTDGIIVTSIWLPPPPTRSIRHAEKIGFRLAFTPSVIGVAGFLSLAPDGIIARARLAVGGGATPAQRLRSAEAKMTGQSAESIDWQRLRNEMAAEICCAGDAVRSAAYRRSAAANVLAFGLGGMTALPPLENKRPATLPHSIASATKTQAILSRSAAGARWYTRSDIREKIAGRFAYLTDVRRDDMLIAGVLLAALPHARILSIDTSRAAALPGVSAVVTYRDVPGRNGYGYIVPDQPVLCSDRVRHIGDMVAAVAAVDNETAERALALIDVDYEPLPVVDDMIAALDAETIAIRNGSNLQSETKHVFGDVGAAWLLCAHSVEDTYVTPRQIHAFMETEGGFAVPEPDGGVTIHVGSQHGLRDRQQLAQILNMEESRIRVVSSPLGGGFGGKEELTVQPILAMLALKTKKPVRIQLDRRTSITFGMKRHPMIVRMRTGIDADGRLLAHQAEVTIDTGAYVGCGPAVLDCALENGAGPYRIPNIRLHGRCVFTNNGNSGAFRGFGANEIAMAMETQINRLAGKAGMDPVAFRRLNLRRPRDSGLFGQALAPSDRIRDGLEAAASSNLWSRPREPTRKGRCVIGIGLATTMSGNGLGSTIPDPGGGRLALAPDGRIEASFGVEEMGQGAVSVIEQLVSASLGCDRSDVVAVIGDTGRVPESGSTTASRVTSMVWRAVQKAAPVLGAELIAAAAAQISCNAHELVTGSGGIYRRKQNSSDAPLMTFAELAAGLAPDTLPNVTVSFEFPKSDYVKSNAHLLYSSATCVVLVEVDRATGMVRMLDIDQHTAAGPVVDPSGYLGQIEGGAIQGMGFTLTEEAIMKAGSYVTQNFDSYFIPTIADTPDRMRTFALEELDPDDPFGPRGVGELGIGAVTPAALAAIADATGAWLSVAPVRPESLLRAIDGMAGETVSS
jgi:nicotinate dehydrogenase large molybdopterin subunit